MSKEKVSVSEYLQKHHLREMIEEAVNACYKQQSVDPLLFFTDYFKKKTQSDKIGEVLARQVLDSRGNPTVEVDVVINGKVFGRAAGPSGASTGSKEAKEIRDGDEKKYLGKSVEKAVKIVNEKIHGILKGQKLNLYENDAMLVEKDATPFKSNLGGNAVTATSFALAYAGAKLSGEELFLYLAKQFVQGLKLKDFQFKLPSPMVNIINGGKHAGGNLMIQEFMIVPRKDVKFKKALKMVAEVYQHLKKLLVEKKGLSSKNVGDEGGFAPNIEDPDEALTFLELAIEKAGYKVGSDISLAIDAAASEFYNKETKKYQVIKGKFISSSELVEFYEAMLDKHPALISIEDGFDEEDIDGWKLSMESQVLNRIMLVGDDLYTTNPKFIKQGIKEKWANALLLKVNQIGTISEAMQAARLIFDAKQQVIVSHRSGETTSSLISDLTVAIGANFIKTGAPCRGERTVKYNRLLQIEEWLEKHSMLLDPKKK